MNTQPQPVAKPVGSASKQPHRAIARWPAIIAFLAIGGIYTSDFTTPCLWAFLADPSARTGAPRTHKHCALAWF